MAPFRRRNARIVVSCVLCLTVWYVLRIMPKKYAQVRNPNSIERELDDFMASCNKDTNYSKPPVHNTMDDTDGIRVDNGVHNTLPGFIICSNSLCEGNIELLVYIQSYWGNFLKRRVIRNTWAGTRSFRDINVRAVFILGKPDDVTDQVMINIEQLIHGDIIEGNFTDSYHNLTIKTIMAVKWIRSYCKNTNFVLKSDDDIFVNVFSVLERVTAVMEHTQSILACDVIQEGTREIVRDKHSKMYIPETVFPDRTTLPRFCSGYAVVMTITAVRSLYKASLHAPLIYVDDVYLFGQLTKDIPDIRFLDLSKNFTLTHQTGLASYRNGDSSDLIAISADQSLVMEELWSLALLKMSPWAKRHYTVHRQGRS